VLDIKQLILFNEHTWGVQNIFERLNVHLSFLVLLLASEELVSSSMDWASGLIEVS